jgi:LysM repeat protein
LLLAGVAIVGAAVALIFAVRANSSANELKTKLGELESTSRSSADQRTIEDLTRRVTDRETEVSSIHREISGFNKKLSDLRNDTSTGFKSVESTIKTALGTGTVRPNTGTTRPNTGAATATATTVVPGVGGEHIIAKGEYLSTLAKRYGVTVEAIQAANPDAKPNNLQIGTKLIIPPRTAPATSATTPTTTGGAVVPR